LSRPEESPPPCTSSEDLDVFEQASADVRQQILCDARRFDDDAAAVAFSSTSPTTSSTRVSTSTVGGMPCDLPRRTYQRVVAELGPLKPYVDDLRIAVASRSSWRPAPI
jgi:hypothetical protein